MFSFAVVIVVVWVVVGVLIFVLILVEVNVVVVFIGNDLVSLGGGGSGERVCSLPSEPELHAACFLEEEIILPTCSYIFFWRGRGVTQPYLVQSEQMSNKKVASHFAYLQRDIANKLTIREKN